MKSELESEGTFDPLVFSDPPYKHSAKSALLSGIFVSPLSIFSSQREISHHENKMVEARTNDWASAIKRILNSGSMWRVTEHMLGFNKSQNITSSSDIWLLGVCYKISVEDSTTGGDPVNSSAFASFVEDFSSRISVTYRKGFDPIGDSRYTSDSGWGCMLRSSQMLVAQALIVHQLGRSWRKSMNKEIDRDYIAILQLFVDSKESIFSIHNLLNAGESHGLIAGSWMGPYAMCRTWENLARTRNEVANSIGSFYIVSDDGNGERGGAPVLCIEEVYRHCVEHSRSEDPDKWLSTIFLVPLVLGLDKVNPRYIPSLAATFAFPQSLGILGGKTGASTYIVGVQDEMAFYLDPHETQQVVKINMDDPEVDTVSYHSNVVRHFPLDSIDPSLAIGFYCKDKDDFDDLCSRASKLANGSNGAPLFTVTQTHHPENSTNQPNPLPSAQDVGEDDALNMLAKGNEDEWQIL
ncbi:hypothetical protein V2J09_021112 [Rumex salicifolius]